MSRWHTSCATFSINMSPQYRFTRISNCPAIVVWHKSKVGRNAFADDNNSKERWPVLRSHLFKLNHLGTIHISNVSLSICHLSEDELPHRAVFLHRSGMSIPLRSNRLNASVNSHEALCNVFRNGDDESRCKWSFEPDTIHVSFQKSKPK